MACHSGAHQEFSNCINSVKRTNLKIIIKMDVARRLISHTVRRLPWERRPEARGAEALGLAQLEEEGRVGPLRPAKAGRIVSLTCVWLWSGLGWVGGGRLRD